MAIRVGVAWATHFDRPLWQQALQTSVRHTRLRYAYRAPSLFLQGMLNAGDDIQFVLCDEDLTSTSLDPGACQDVDILYVASHGGLGSNGFSVALHALDWDLLTSNFGGRGPAVVVFDCCNLDNVKQPGWTTKWENSSLGTELRMVLGFRSAASVSKLASIRGRAFATMLRQLPVKDAWFGSMQAGAYYQTDEPLAIAFGDDPQDAQNTLDTLDIDNLPGPRTSATPTVKAKY
ncbi:DUF6345 domain-containing protein [Kribbella sp. NPDC056951]|uniref:DUF6345 domain-containing protein n=1 Tax=Kribbella sp. NPDC056951 TaxID=3345978 RepID=UPI003629C837